MGGLLRLIWLSRKTRKISCNTFNTLSQVDSKNVDYPDSRTFQTVKSEVRNVYGKDL